MWILHFLPDAFILWVTNIVLLAGVVLVIAGLFAHRIPLIWQYQLPFKILGLVLLAAGVYFRGGYGVEMAWRERVAEVEAKMRRAEKESQDANAALAAATKQRQDKVREKVVIVKQYIDREVTKHDTKFQPGGVCEIPREFVDAHNQAADKSGATVK